MRHHSDKQSIIKSPQKHNRVGIDSNMASNNKATFYSLLSTDIYRCCYVKGKQNKCT